MMLWRIAGMLLIGLVTVFVHLALMWLWNPAVQPLAPRIVKLSRVHQGETVLAFAGDTALTDAASETLRKHGYEYALAPSMHLLSDAALAVVNLETVVATKDTRFPLYKRYVYRMEPAGLAALRWAGIDAVALANNHLKDHGTRGMVATLRALRRAELVGIGAGITAREARRGVVFVMGDLRIGLLSYLEDSPMHSVYMQSFAWGWRPGVARMERGHLSRDIARLRKKSDLVIVMPHWGRSYAGVTLLQRHYGRYMIDAGADAVIGHHPHLHHPVALHRGRPIIYSLGNYAFGTPGRSFLRHGLVARLVVANKRLLRVELHPLLVQNRLVAFKPEPLTGQEARTMLDELARASREHGAKLKVVGEKAVLTL